MKKSLATVVYLAILCFVPAIGNAATIWQWTGSETHGRSTATLQDYWSKTILASTIGTQTDPMLTLTFKADLSGITTALGGFAVKGIDPSGAVVISPVTNGLNQLFTFTVPTSVFTGSSSYTLDAYIQQTGKGSSVTFTEATLSNSAKTPIPAAALLLGSGVLGLVGIGKARRKTPNV